MINRKSISFKLFAVTSVFLIVFISIAMLLQIALFDQFYTNRKTNTLKTNLMGLRDTYLKSAANSDEFSFSASQYQGENNTDIVIIKDTNTSAETMISWGITSNAYSANAAIDGEIQVIGIKPDWTNTVIKAEENSTYIAKSVTVKDTSALSSKDSTTITEAAAPEASVNTVTVTAGEAQPVKAGTVITRPEENNISISFTVKDAAFETASRYWRSILTDKEKHMPSKEDIYTYYYTHPIFNTKYIILIAPVNFENGHEDAIFSISPLQPIDEAGEIIKAFYAYVFFAAVFLILLLSLFYSNMVSKPLINLNNTANKMLGMDFSAKCEVRTDDEIGNLAKTMNFLWEKLGITLADFKRANEKLTKDIEKERSLEKMRKEFIAGVSHELKTPLSLISGYAESLNDHIVSEDMKDYYLEVIMDETAKMDGLINDMLDLSQIESGNYSLKRTCFNFYDLIVATTKKYAKSIEEKNIMLAINVENQAVGVYADAFRIEQVLTNFLTNAIRHTPAGGEIRIILSTAGTAAQLQFENTGSRIDAEALERIWDRFYKIDKSRNRQSGGIGLGLAIVKNILLLHQSRFGVENMEDGVRFYFDLPTP